jgi:hypothetical protein
MASPVKRVNGKDIEVFVTPKKELGNKKRKYEQIKSDETQLKPFASLKEAKFLAKTIGQTHESNKKPRLESEGPNFSTPPLRKHLSFIPSTPGKNAFEDIQNVFPNPLPSFPDDFFKNLEVPKGIELSNFYFLKEKKHTLIQQSSSKDCGAAALLMLYTNVMRSRNKISPFNPEFWEWYSNSILRDAQGIVTGSQLLKGIKLEVRILKEEDQNKLDLIKTHMDQSGFSCIVSISEPIGGHWIVVDEIGEKYVYIRDPNSGTAYKISRKNLIDYFCDDPQTFLFIP